MAEFDPYLKWLGIRDKTRPVSHYRLLGIDLYESDPEVIHAAADRQMAHIRTFQAGPNGDATQKLLNELSRARRCLLTPEKKAAYDEELRGKSQAQLQTTAVAQPVAFEAAVQSVEVTFSAQNQAENELKIRQDPNSKQKARRRAKSRFLMSLVSWISGGLAALGVAAWMINSGLLGEANKERFFGNGKTSTATANPLDANIPDVLVDNDSLDEKKEKPSSRISNMDGLESKPVKVPKSPKVKVKDSNFSSRSENQFDDSNSKRVSPQPIIRTPDAKLPVGMTKEGSPTSNSTVPTAPINRSLVSRAWTIAELPNYPVAYPELAALYRFLDETAKVRFAASIDLNPQFKTTKTDNDPSTQSARVLIGAIGSLSEQGQIQSIQPVYASMQSAILGPMIGKESKLKIASIAKPGFAVGELERSIFSPANCFRLKFYKVKSDGLDQQDCYWGPWIGKAKGPTQRIENPTGLVVVGLTGTQSKNAMHHVQLEFAASVAPDIASASQPIPGSSSPPAISFFNTAENETKPAPKRELPAMVPGRNLIETDNPTTPDADSANRLEPPDKQALKVAEKDVLRIYPSVARASRRMDLKRAADQLIVNAQIGENTPEIDYAMLDRARAIGVGLGDANLAIQALDITRKMYNIDYWDLAESTLKEVSANTNSFAFFKEELDGVIESALDEENFEAAGKLLSFGKTIAKNVGDFDTKEDYEKQSKRVVELKRLARKLDDVLATLKTDPENTEANEIFGLYLFMARNDEQKALFHWQKSGPGRLLELSRIDEETDSANAEAMVKLANAWIAAGEEQKPVIRKSFLETAQGLLMSAALKLDGVAKRRAVNQAEELQEKIDRY